MKQATLRRLISIGMLLVLVVLFTILSGMSFLNSTNLINILRDASVVAIVGVGVTYVIITSGIDLSTGAIMAVVGMVMANVYAYTLWPIPVMLLIGVALWGVGMGAQESILKAAVTSMVPKASRATGYGVFECSFGAFWFLGSWLMGVLYDVSIPAMIAVSVIAQLATIPLYIGSSKLMKKDE